VIAKAERMLGHSTEDARHRVYERARSAVLAEMNRAHPQVDQSDILAAQMCLEAADALRNQRAQAVKGVSSTAHQSGQQRFAPIARRWARVFRPADGRGQFREQVPSDHLPSMHSGKGRDP
jgi:hypothetical protein